MGCLTGKLEQVEGGEEGGYLAALRRVYVRMTAGAKPGVFSLSRAEVPEEVVSGSVVV